jgi:hypothetical protein
MRVVVIYCPAGWLVRFAENGKGKIIVGFFFFKKKKEKIPISALDSLQSAQVGGAT